MKYELYTRAESVPRCGPLKPTDCVKQQRRDPSLASPYWTNKQGTVRLSNSSSRSIIKPCCWKGPSRRL